MDTVGEAEKVGQVERIALSNIKDSWWQAAMLHWEFSLVLCDDRERWDGGGWEGGSERGGIYIDL